MCLINNRFTQLVQRIGQLESSVALGDIRAQLEVGREWHVRIHAARRRNRRLEQPHERHTANDRSMSRHRLH